MRAFVKSHPEYEGEGKVSRKVCEDLVREVVEGKFPGAWDEIGLKRCEKVGSFGDVGRTLSHFT